MKTVNLKNGMLEFGYMDIEEFLKESLSHIPGSEISARTFYENNSHKQDMYIVLENSKFTFDDDYVVRMFCDFGVTSYDDLADYGFGVMTHIQKQVGTQRNITYFFRYFSEEEYRPDIVANYNYVYRDNGKVAAKLRTLFIDDLIQDLE